MATDCGSETTVMYGIMNALRCVACLPSMLQLANRIIREQFHPEYIADELPAHVYLRSIHNTPIERTWRAFHVGLGDNAIKAYQSEADRGMYNPEDAEDQ